MNIRGSSIGLLCGALLLVAGLTLGSASATGARAGSWPGGSKHSSIECGSGIHIICAELNDGAKKIAWGNKYVGHDEPSVLFYSKEPRSGSQMRYHLTLPSDPAYGTAGATYNYELQPAFWFGMAMCDSKSYPLTQKTCRPNTDANIQPPAKHPGGAYMELQFYPPGDVPQPVGFSCDPTKWCAALNIDSYSVNPVTGQTLNGSCASAIRGGLEYINFAYVTKNGKATTPANPVQDPFGAFNIDPKRDFFMNAGDNITITIKDKYTFKKVNGKVRSNLPNDGLQVILNDETTGKSGKMTASKDNGFGQVAFKPAPSAACRYIPYNFHPMYSTSGPNTTVPWTAHAYNVAFSGEIGHFDYCYPYINSTTEGIEPGGSCPGDYLEGFPNDWSNSDGDDNFCFSAGFFSSGVGAIDLGGNFAGPGGAATSPYGGCLLNNTGFDGPSYNPVWPDGNPLHPGPTYFSSPTTGGGFSDQYQQAAFETDLPAIEPYPTCSHVSGAGCSLLPRTDDEQAANFYPFYTTGKSGGSCWWSLGNDIPGFTTSDYGKNSQFGGLLAVTYPTGDQLVSRYEDFHNTLPNNPCPYTAGGGSSS